MNKDLLKELQAYFLKQDPQVIATALAGAMLDIHRFIKIEFLSEKEAKSLIIRSESLCDELIRFSKNGDCDSGPMQVTVLNSKEDE